MKALMLVGGTISRYIAEGFFMSDVLKELFLVKQSVVKMKKEEDSESDE